MNTFGEKFRITTWGESHGKAVGVVIDGCPAGLELKEEDIEKELLKDKPDEMIGTPRNESNNFEILSGVYKNMTLGTPISIIIQNNDVRSKDYSLIRKTYRPGHGDFVYEKKYIHTDWRGGSRASGREVIARLAASGVALKLIKKTFPSIRIISYIREMAGIRITSKANYIKARKAVIEAGKKGDSTGGIVEVRLHNLPDGLGDPVFSKFDAELSAALMGIGAVKGVEIGRGFNLAKMKGSSANDQYFIYNEQVHTMSNNSGGILSGITSGEIVKARIVVKPTPTIAMEQMTVTRSGEETFVSYQGRHDMNITPRIASAAGAMSALLVADFLIRDGYIDPVTLLKAEKRNHNTESGEESQIAWLNRYFNIKV